MKYSVILSSLILLGPPATAVAQQRDQPMESFRSELWQQEYRSQEDKDQEKQDVDQETLPDDAEVAASSKSRPSRNSSLNAGLATSSAPGQMELDELRDSTPIAEWQIDSGADREVGEMAFRNEASAWQLSQVTDLGDGTQEMAQGPTITTYLVGLMACIVVVGVLITGRD